MTECPIPDDLGPILVGGEQPWAAHKTFRDSAITNKRLIGTAAARLQAEASHLSGPKTS